MNPINEIRKLLSSRNELRPEERVCPWWLIRMIDNPIRNLVHKPEKILDGLVSEGMTILDIGCGIGYFTIPMARMAGPSGKVIAVDLQERMLNGVRRRAKKAGLAERIVLRQCSKDSLSIDGIKAGFALTFYMVHEVPDKDRFFREIAENLVDGGKLLIVEPLMHVSPADFEKTLETAGKSGFAILTRPDVRWSRAALLGKKLQAERSA